MENFTLSLALFDAVPVIFFSISMLNIAKKFNSPFFLLGTLLFIAASVMKISWKLLLGVFKKDIPFLNKPFVPMQITAASIILLSIIFGFKRINFEKLIPSILSFPSCIFLALWLLMMSIMIWYSKKKFERYSAKANWTAEIVNALGQFFLLLSILSL